MRPPCAVIIAIMTLAGCEEVRPRAVHEEGGGDDRPHGDGGGGTPSRTARFALLGDTGTGDENQHAVASALYHVCKTEGCDFVILLGDNLYDDGAYGVTDEAWQERFELPYAYVDETFYAILGNHDFGLQGIDVDRAAVQIAYTAVSSKWRMPAAHYTLRAGPVGILALDTTSIFLGDTTFGSQQRWSLSALQAIRGAPWTIAIGHHPMRSNGVHGNAEGELAAFFDEFVCGVVDVYIAAHDHDREWLDDPEACGGTELIVNGAGGKVDAFQRDETPAHWQDDTTIGFLYVVADAQRFTGRFVDADGTTAFERTIERPPPAHR